MEITGKIHRIGQVEQISATFRKREVVIEHSDNPMYPQFNSFQLTQDKVGILDGYNVGDQINFGFNLRGRAWTSPSGEEKYFNTLEIWRISLASSLDESSQGSGDYGGSDLVPAGGSGAKDDEDLPF